MTRRIAIVVESLSHSDESLRSCVETLDAGERRRAADFACGRSRLRFIAGRALLRAILARQLNCAPASVKFETGAHGKPRLAGGRPLKFNLSHSGDRMAVALSWESEVGIDIEQLRPEIWPDLEAMAAHTFPPQICRRIAALPPSARISAFYRQWTKQEASLKAHGTGFSRAAPSSAASAVTVRELALGSALGGGWFGAVAAEGDFEISLRRGFGPWISSSRAAIVRPPWPPEGRRKIVVNSRKS